MQYKTKSFGKNEELVTSRLIVPVFALSNLLHEVGRFANSLQLLGKGILMHGHVEKKEWDIASISLALQCPKPTFDAMWKQI